MKNVDNTASYKINKKIKKRKCLIMNANRNSSPNPKPPFQALILFSLHATTTTTTTSSIGISKPLRIPHNIRPSIAWYLRNYPSEYVHLISDGDPHRHYLLFRPQSISFTPSVFDLIWFLSTNEFKYNNLRNTTFN